MFHRPHLAGSGRLGHRLIRQRGKQLLRGDFGPLYAFIAHKGLHDIVGKGSPKHGIASLSRRPIPVVIKSTKRIIPLIIIDNAD